MSSNASPSRLDIAKSFLVEARNELREYEECRDEAILRLVCEKGWGAIAQALMYAVGRDVTHHNDYQKIANELRQSGKFDVIDATLIGDKLHSAGFYHGKLSVNAIKESIAVIEQAVDTLDTKI
jgi:hypothetical protein